MLHSQNVHTLHQHLNCFVAAVSNDLGRNLFLALWLGGSNLAACRLFFPFFGLFLRSSVFHIQDLTSLPEHRAKKRRNPHLFPHFWRLDTRASKAQLAKIRTRCLFGWFGVSLDECKTLGNHPTLNPPNAFKQTPLLEYTQCTPPVEQSSLLWLIQWARGNCALKRSVAARPCCPPVWRATRGGAKRLGCSAL